MNTLTLAEATNLDLFEYHWEGIADAGPTYDWAAVITRTDGMQLVYSLDTNPHGLAEGWTWAEYEGDYRDGNVTAFSGDVFETDKDIQAAAEFIKNWAAQAN